MNTSLLQAKITMIEAQIAYLTLNNPIALATAQAAATKQLAAMPAQQAQQLANLNSQLSALQSQLDSDQSPSS